MKNISRFVPFAKVDDNGDGTATVTGIFSTEKVDAEDDIIDYDALKKAIYRPGGYDEWRTLRAMHQSISAGIAEDILCVDKTRKSYMKALVIDPVEAKKTLAGVYKGFSIGGRSNESTLEMVDGRAVTRHTDIDILEVSLADRPANPEAVFTFVKIAAAPALKPVSQSSQATSPANFKENAMSDEMKEAVVAGATNEADEVTYDSATIQEALNLIGRAVAGELADGETDQAAMLQTARKQLLAWLAAEAAEVDAAIADVDAAGAAGDASEPPEEDTPERRAEAAETPEEEAIEEPEGETDAEGDASASDDEANVAAFMKKVLASPDLAGLIKTVVNAQMKAQITKGGTQVTQTFAKLDDVATRLGALEKRVKVIVKRGSVAGPVLRAIPGANDDGAGTEVDVLSRLIEKEDNSAMRQNLMSKRADLLIKQVHASGGNHIGR